MTTPPTPRSARYLKAQRIAKRIAIGAGVLMFGSCGIALIAGNTGPKPSPNADSPELQSRVVKNCERNIRQGLKDPDSAKFAEWKVWRAASDRQPPAGMAFRPDQGDAFYQASVAVNAKNAFGAYVGARPYFCNMVFPAKGSGLVEAHEIDLGRH